MKDRNKMVSFNIANLVIIFLISLLLSSCSKSNKMQVKTEQIFAMDTIIQLTVYGEQAEQAIQEAKGMIRQYDDWFSVTNSDSEVSRINTHAGELVEVRKELIEQLEYAKEISKRSEGAFDVTIYPVVREWGFTTKEFQVPTESEIAEALKLVNYQNIQIVDSKVRIKEKTSIDLGGIAKGYTGYRLKERFQELGVEAAVISLGGNVQTMGKKPDKSKWSVGITDPNQPEAMIGTVQFEGGAVVTSGNYQRFFKEDGKVYHHIMDPKTGHPSDSGLSSVTILCENGAEADGLSTALYVMGEVKALEYQKTYGGFEAILIREDNSIIVTEGIKDSFAAIGK